MPIRYMEWECDRCGDGDIEPECAVMRNGDLICKTCANKDPDNVFKWLVAEAIIETDIEDIEAEQEQE